MKRNGRVGYLSASLRSSTRMDAEAGGPRSHILGVMGGFRALGWEVKPFIVGDRLPRRCTSPGSEKALSGSYLRALLADLLRLGLGTVNSHRAWHELGQGVDLVYERFASFQPLGRIFQRRGIPWVLETQGLFYREAKVERKSLALSSVARRIETDAYRQCDLLVCVSSQLKQMVVDETGVAAEKVIVVPNGVDAGFFDPDKFEPQRSAPELTIGFVGNLAKWQGIDLLLRAVHDLQGEGLSTAVVVVGGGQMLDAWKSLAAALGLAACARFTGSVPGSDVPQCIAGFDVGYAGETFMDDGTMYHSPLKIYEYLAMGKPVLAAAFDDAKQILREGATGFLFRPSDVDDLKRALRACHEKRQCLAGMRAAARQTAVESASWESRIKMLLDHPLLQKALEPWQKILEP